MSTKNAVFGVFAAVVASAFATVPNVTYVHMEQSPSSRLVTIQYKFSGDDAVITLDVQTNANTSASASDPGWTSIGGEAICNAQGEVWRKVVKVSDDTVHTISWLPDRSWVGENGDGFSIAANGARAVVTAWATNNTPDYMVVDVSNSATPNTQDARCRYYPSVDFLPGSAPRQVGAVTNNPNYKTSLLVMRKIYAKDVTCILGSTPQETRRTSANEKTRQVTIANNYYIGIFELTQGQWAEVVTGRPRPSYFSNPTYRAARPVEQICYNDVRCADCTVATSGTGQNAMGPSTAGGLYPDPPYTGSFLDHLRSRTGVDFDLPSETQWEFACRAGHGDGKYGNGSAILNSTTSDANLAPQTRYLYNNASNNTNPGENVDTTMGTVTVGSCVPNDWGLYEMLGNVMELCLDKYQTDVSGLAGAVKVDSSLTSVVGKGGHFVHAANSLRPAYRTDYEMNKRHRPQLGFRVVCRAGLD